MIPTAQLCHAIPGRTRIRVSAKRRDHAYFLAVQQKLADFEGVDTVDVNPTTASLLLHHQSSKQAIVEFARSQGLFQVKEPDDSADAESKPISERAYGSLHALDQHIRGLSRGGVDFWGAMFLVMLGLGVNEFIKGNISSPATTMLWYAVGALMLAQGNKEAA
jgi:Heavy metal associated domain 2